MATDTLVKTVSNSPQTRLPAFALMRWRGLRLALFISISLGLGAAVLEWLLRPALQSVNVEENFTATLSAPDTNCVLLIYKLTFSMFLAPVPVMIFSILNVPDTLAPDAVSCGLRIM